MNLYTLRPKQSDLLIVSAGIAGLVFSYMQFKVIDQVTIPKLPQGGEKQPLVSDAF